MTRSYKLLDYERETNLAIITNTIILGTVVILVASFTLTIALLSSFVEIHPIDTNSSLGN
tara:strand:+ start:876 stop:1055 length:180 start_codon:yes stop_codon:yes gene_type:complete